MKINRKSAIIVATLAIATTGALTISNKADAATIATTHSGTYSSLYRENGQIISNRALGPNTPWLVGKITAINGETMYQVSTNEYLRARDASLNGQQTPVSTKLVGTATKQLRLYNRHDGKMASNRALGSGTAWQIGDVFENKDGITFVQVSTNEYANAADMTFNQTLNPTYVEDFGAGNDFGGSSTDTSTDNNQSHTTAPDTNTNNDSSHQNESSQPDLAGIKSAVFESINGERQSKGLAPLTEDSRIDTIAAKRAQEISTSFSHTRPDGNNVYTELISLTGLSGQGENISGDVWNQLSEQSSQRLAKVIMDNFRGEGITSTWNHYSAIINPDAKHVGIGVYYGSDGDVYTVEDFAN